MANPAGIVPMETSAMAASDKQGGQRQATGAPGMLVNQPAATVTADQGGPAPTVPQPASSAAAMAATWLAQLHQAPPEVRALVLATLAAPMAAYKRALPSDSAAAPPPKSPCILGDSSNVAQGAPPQGPAAPAQQHTATPAAFAFASNPAAAAGAAGAAGGSATGPIAGAAQAAPAAAAPSAAAPTNEAAAHTTACNCPCCCEEGNYDENGIDWCGDIGVDRAGFIYRRGAARRRHHYYSSDDYDDSSEEDYW